MRIGTSSAEIFASIPTTYRGRARKRAPAAWRRAGAEPDCFIEGPAFDRAGNLFVVDIPFGRIFKVSPSGDVELFLEYDGEPNGLKIHQDGRMFLADHQNGIMVLDPLTKTIGICVGEIGGHPFRGVNDLVFASNGDLYFTDQGETGLHDPSGRLFRLSHSGGLSCLLNNVPSPNGLILDASEDTIFLAVTRGNCVWRVPLASDGSVTRVGIFVQLSGGIGPDGLALDEEGGLAIAHLGLGCVWLTNRKGEPIHRIQSSSGDWITNVAYGGPDYKHLYMTESETGRILVAPVKVPGRIMFSHR